MNAPILVRSALSFGFYVCAAIAIVALLALSGACLQYIYGLHLFN